MVILVLFSCNLVINVPITLASDKEDMNTRIDLYHNIDTTWKNIYQGYQIHCDSLWEKNENEKNQTRCPRKVTFSRSRISVMQRLYLYHLRTNIMLNTTNKIMTTWAYKQAPQTKQCVSVQSIRLFSVSWQYHTIIYVYMFCQ